MRDRGAMWFPPCRFVAYRVRSYKRTEQAKELSKHKKRRDKRGVFFTTSCIATGYTVSGLGLSGSSL